MAIRKKQEQAWLSKEFKDKLEVLQAKKRLLGKKVSMGDLTDEIVKAKSWEQLEKEILELDKVAEKGMLKIGIKFDGGIK
jgi:hypothetical protein